MPQEDWFREWFDTPYYHQMYKHRDERDAQLLLDNILDFLQPKQNAKILDLACGRGRHSSYLTARGFDVYGLDLSPQNIEFAEKHHRAKHFKVQDMRESFGENMFDYVFNLFTSFGYFNCNDQHLKAIKNMTTALRSGGVLVLDFMNAHKVSQGLVPDEKLCTDDITFYIKRYVADDKIVKEINFTDGGKTHQYKEEVALLTLADFEEFYKHAGLELIGTFGDFHLHPYSEENSDRLITMAKKL